MAQQPTHQWCPKCNAMLPTFLEVCPRCDTDLATGKKRKTMRERALSVVALVLVSVLPIIIFIAIGAVCAKSLQ